MQIRAILFDKDGTLFDFGATWNAWARAAIRDLAGGDAAAEARIASALRYDMAAGVYLPDSPVIAGTNREAAERIAEALPGVAVDDIERRLVALAVAAPQVPAVPLAPLLDALTARGLGIGVVTNDSERPARAHLAAAGLGDRFAFVAGADSGFGAKPDPGPLSAFAAALGLPPGAVAMVGDSTHDLRAARAAGMVALAVLTGPAGREVLAPLAEAVLDDIGGLPAWLDMREGVPGTPAGRAGA